MRQIKDQGVWYTQREDGLPIEERVFFREAIGMSADDEHYRPATDEELDAKRVYDERIEREAERWKL